MAEPNGEEPDRKVLVVSCFSEDGRQDGGVFLIAPDGVETLDDRMTTGLYFDTAARRWARAVSASASQHSATVVVEYVRRRGSPVVRCLGGLPDAHQLLVEDGAVFAAATYENAIVRLKAHSRRRVCTLPGEPDSWHVNGLAAVDGEIFATAFHRGGTFRQWSQELVGAGLLFSLTSGAVVVDALSAPHSPRYVDGLWLLCDSATEALVAIDPARPLQPAHRIDLGGWTRGLAVDGDLVHVGVSARRRARGDSAATASIAVVDRTTWTVVERIPVPCAEIFDICVSTRSEAEMLAAPLPERTFLRTRSLRSPVRHPRPARRSRGSVAVAESRSPADGAVRPLDFPQIAITSRSPKRVQPGEIFGVAVTLENRSGETLVSTESRPLNLSYRWVTNAGLPPVSVSTEEPIRTTLPLVPRGGRASVQLIARAPAIPGRFHLRVTVVHEGVRWLDDGGDAFGETVVEVSARRGPRAALRFADRRN